MGGTKRYYSNEFKLEAVRLYETSRKGAREVESELDITPGLLSKWRGRYRQDQQAAFPGTGHQTDMEAELRRLKRELEVVRQERDILKKAIQVFSRDGHL
jgi:transposase